MDLWTAWTGCVIEIHPLGLGKDSGMQGAELMSM